MALIDLTGQIFGSWTVIKQDKDLSREKNRAYWVCQCECGTIKSVRGESLRNGRSTNCGCKRIKDLTGQRFGYIEVLERDMTKHERDTYWICKCHGCGKTFSIDSHHLQKNQSCGCMKYNIISEKMSEHLEGQVFGKLTVIERDKTKPSGKDAYWTCRCECGNICSIRSIDLTKGKTKSCGCANSKGELKIGEVLTHLNINYIIQYKFEDLYGEKDKLRFDFYLPDNNILIEYQGIQHYSPQEHFGGQKEYDRRVKYDNLKREYCKKNNYKLIEIPYYDYDKINQNYILNLLEERTNA